MDKLKSSICFSCCIRGTDVDPLAHEYLPNPSSASPSTWASQISHLKEKYRSRAGMHRRRNSTGNFGYDPLSYALNFDQGLGFDDDGGEISPAEYKYRNFSSRLPPTPPHVTPPTKEEVTCR